MFRKLKEHRVDVDIATQFRAFLKVGLSGLLNAQTYKSINPACRDFGTIKCIWHWVRHGIHEERKPSDTVFINWALPNLTLGKLALSDLPILMEANKHNSLKEAFNSLGLDYNEFEYLAAYEKGDFEKAKALLPFTKGSFLIRHVHRSLRNMPVIPNLADIYRSILSEFGSDISQLPNAYRSRIYDIAYASGEAWDVLADIANLIPHSSFKLDQNKVFADQTISSADFSLNLAEYNRRQKHNFVGIRQTERDIFEACEAKFGDTIIFVPNTQLWQSNGVMENSICQAYKNILLGHLRKGETLIYLPLAQTRDLTNVNLPSDKAISYHTYAQNRPKIKHYKESSIKGFFLIDSKGYSGASEIGQSLEFSDTNSDKFEQLKAAYISTQITKYDQSHATDILPEHGYIFVAMQVYDDSVRRWQFLSSSQIVQTLAALKKQEPNLRIVVKRHPFDTSSAVDTLLDTFAAAQLITVVNASIQKLIEGAKCVVVANSGVGIEALMMGKPVISTGLSEYTPATHLCRTKKELSQAVLNEFTQANHSSPKEYLNYFFNNHLIELDQLINL